MPLDSESILATAIERLNDKMDRIDEKVDTVQADVNKFVVLFEKLSNIEKAQVDSSKRIHHRMDGFENRIEKIEDKQMNTGCPTFQRFVSAHDNELRHNVEKIHNFESFKKDTERQLKDLALKPAKKWEHMNTVFITAVVALLVSFIAVKIGLK